jgi:ATP-dependent helicase Lhr and Lhr-like helicase
MRATASALERAADHEPRPGEAEHARALVLAATDPANPFGGAAPWPARGRGGAEDAGHRPGRKAGAVVVLVDGRLVLYVERGGRTLLTWSDDAARLHPAAHSLSEAGRRGALGRITVEKADGAQILGGGSTPLREALDAAGFVSTPRGLRLRG